MADKLAVYVHVDGQAYGPGDEVPTDVAKRITNPDAWEGGEVPVFEEEPKSQYDALKVADLKAEIESRNADRADEDKIPADGNKGDLVAALEADDESKSE